MADVFKPIFDFMDYIAERTQDFMGREWVFAEIDAWLAKPDAPRYFIITGEPGIGKTALAGRLTQIREFDAIHFCIARQADTIDPLNFVRSISLQLTRIEGFAQNILKEKNVKIDVHISNVREVQGDVIGVKIENLLIEAENAAIAFARAVSSPLRQIYADGYDRKLVILVDALDEAVRQQGAETIVSLLENARSLPEQVRFLLTARPDADALRHFEELKLPYLQLDAGREENQKDVREYVVQRVEASDVLQTRLREQDTSVQAFVERVATASQGNFLYLVWLLRGIAEGTQRFETLDDLPDGLDGIYREFLRTRTVGENQKNWQMRYRSLLGVLAAAQMPLTAGQLLNFSGLTQQDVNDLLFDVRQFLAPGQAEQGQYQLYHQSLPDFLQKQERAKEFWIDLPSFHQRIATYYQEQIATHWEMCDEYGLRYQSFHLLEAKCYETLFTLARDRDFQQVQIQIFPDDPTLPLRTLQTALRGAADNNNAPAMAEFLLAHARYIVQSQQETPLEALHSGSLSRAWELADLDDIENCLKWYLLLIWELKDHNRISEAQKTLHRLRKKELPKTFAEDIIYPLTETCTVDQNGFFDLCQRLVKDDKTYLAICRCLIEKRLFDITIKVVRQIEDNRNQVEVLRAIASTQAQSGDQRGASTTFAVATQIARQIENKRWLAEVLRDMASQAENREIACTIFATAIEIALQIEDHRGQTEVLRDIAVAQTQAGDQEGARKTLASAMAITQQIIDCVEQAEALKVIAVAQADIDDLSTARTTFAAAVETAEHIKSDWERARVLRTIAVAQAQSGHKEESQTTFTIALKTAKDLENVYLTDWQTKGFVETILTGMFARDIWPQIKKMLDRAILQVVGGNREGARKTFAMAVTTALQSFEDNEDRFIMFKQIMEVQAQVGEFASAVETIWQIGMGRIQGEELQAMARVQAQAEEFSAALTTAQQIELDRNRTKILRAIAIAQIQAGYQKGARLTLSKAFDTIQQIKGWNEKEEVLQTIVQLQTQIGDISGAHKTFAMAMRSVEESEYEEPPYAVAIRPIAVAQAQVGDVSGALATARRIQWDWELVAALTDIAVIQAQFGDVVGAQKTLRRNAGSKNFRMEVLRAITAAQAKQGEFMTARATVRKIKSDWKRMEALQAIATAQAQSGDVAGTMVTVQQIESARKQAETLHVIATNQAQTGDIAGALSTTRKIKKREQQIETLRNIAMMQLQAGDTAGARITFATALKISRQTDWNQYIAKALQEVALVQAQVENQEGAEVTCKAAVAIAWQIESDWDRAEVLRAIAMTQMQAGDFMAAIQTAQQIKVENYRAEALQTIALAQTQIREFTTAIKTAGQIPLVSYAVKTLCSIALKQIQRGDRKGGFRTLETAHSHTIGWKWDRAEAKLAIAMTYVHTQNIDRAIHIARYIDVSTVSDTHSEMKEIMNLDAQAQALAAIATVQAQNGDVVGATKTAEGIQLNWRKTTALVNIAKVQLQNGNKEGAEATFMAAMCSASKITWTKAHAKALQDIAVALAQANYMREAFKNFLEAKEATREIACEEDRAEALAAIAATQARVGYDNAADSTALTIEIDRYQTEAFIAIGVAQAQAGKFAKAMETARQIDCEEERVEVLTAIAKAQTRAGDGKSAQEIARKIQDEALRTEVFTTIAQIQVKTGFPEEALHTADLILVERNKHLPAIADEFVAMEEKMHFKRLLPPCAYYLDATYQMCSKLARLYPDQATAIADIILSDAMSHPQVKFFEPIEPPPTMKTSKKPWWKFWK